LFDAVVSKLLLMHLFTCIIVLLLQSVMCNVLTSRYLKIQDTIPCCILRCFWNVSLSCIFS